ncbi:Nif3-like dinuclear metal center hexameric protein [Candidatus Enterococcus willemsii]|uniref:GTP cyclohydrolase 1 type 2 homolog n=1 Tax=Candidatus Enterococcus willemsii TaxID=1857215 RepID=A0ABQ6YZB9_9ENTE|nr:Nif3-like dinuclear metal center hexameric protein [Enterococcus sp. CU12B]KAF1303824.1 Nif3-like dinuclear metal center hexameric protein [Enterococcus sp. CU12B]
MSLSAKTFIRRFEEYCPQWLAEEGDPVGLHIGTLDKDIQRVMMTLDVRPEVVEEAIEKKVDLIIAKHPPIFRPIKRLTEDDLQTKMYIDLLRHNISVYAAHTNMDIIEDGLNDWFCEMLDVQVTGYLKKTHEVLYKKLVVYTPIEASQQMRQALGDAGAGTQGNYHHTSYSMIGTGRFTPTADANPTIGAANQPEQVQEARIEVIFPETIQSKVLAAMYNTHPYEEPAYDILSLGNPPKTYGIGRVGKLKTPMTIEAFTEKVKAAFGLAGLRLIEATQPKKIIETVAICGGSGGNFYPDALRAGADVYITGDVYYHTAHDMQTNGLTVIDPGHNIEKVCIPKFVEKMEMWKAEQQWEIDIIPSETDTNPFQLR